MNPEGEALAPRSSPPTGAVSGTSESDRLLTIDEVADYLQVPKSTLYGWRYKGSGPHGLRVGKHLRYRLRDVEDWLDSLGSTVSRSRHHLGLRT